MTTFHIDSTEIRDMALEIMERMGYEDGTHIFEAAIEATVQAMLDDLGSSDIQKMTGFNSHLRTAQVQYGYGKPAPVFANHAPHGVPPNHFD